MTNPANECDCKEMSCKEGCTRNHTHKGFFCEKCEPEMCQETYKAEPVTPDPTPAKEWQSKFKEIPYHETTQQIDFIQTLLTSHSAHLVESEREKSKAWAETAYKRGYEDCKNEIR
jgi:hypothetical protein